MTRVLGGSLRVLIDGEPVELQLTNEGFKSVVNWPRKMTAADIRKLDALRNAVLKAIDLIENS